MINIERDKILSPQLLKDRPSAVSTSYRFSDPNQVEQVDVLLINMPFSPLLLPSIGLGLLQAGLERVGIAARTLYFSLDFASIYGTDFYFAVTNTPTTHLTGDWLFADALFPDGDLDSGAYVRLVLGANASSLDAGGGNDSSFIRELVAVRATIPSFLSYCARTVESFRPRLVGFTSVFAQNVASLALAKELKECMPSALIVFGGANCEGEMGQELLSSFPFVDVVVSGEADEAFLQLVRHHISGKCIPEADGIYTQHGTRAPRVLGQCARSTKPIHDLDSLPYPQYADFFRQLADKKIRTPVRPRLLLETSRGCWWGQHHHCTFCGLNGQSMGYRLKSPARALEEVVHLVRLHPGYNVSVTDNILPMEYFDNVIPSLAKMGLGVELFYEVKANLKKWQIRLLRDAGIIEIQPGIESLNTNVFRLMKKSVSAIQNIRLLKWCKELGVRPYWNLLWGFPSEDPADYTAMAKLIPSIVHLTPPAAVSRIRLDRFSPNFDRAGEFGISEIEPHAAYRHIYPFPIERIRRLAYYFEFAAATSASDYVSPLVGAVEDWKGSHATAELFMIDQGDRLLVCRTRACDEPRVSVFTGVLREILMETDDIADLREMAGQWARANGASRDAFGSILARLQKQGILFREGNAIVNLATKLSPDWPPIDVVRRVVQWYTNATCHDSSRRDLGVIV